MKEFNSSVPEEYRDIKMRKEQEIDSEQSMGKGALEVHFPIGSLCTNKRFGDRHIVILGYRGDYGAHVIENKNVFEMSLYVLLTYWESV